MYVKEKSRIFVKFFQIKVLFQKIKYKNIGVKMSIRIGLGHKKSIIQKLHENAIKFLGILLVFTFLIGTIFSTFAFGASETKNADPNKDVNNKWKVIKEKYKNSVMMKIGLNELRIEAAKRYEDALKLKKPKKAAVPNAAFMPAVPLPAGMDPGGVPFYYGDIANYANSPMPTFPMVTTPTSFGNPLIGRNIQTDSAANVFVVNNHIPLSNGTLTAFQIYNMPGSGPNTFRANILRPTQVPGQYTVVFDSGQLTVPSVTTGQIQTFTLTTPFQVQKGDLIAHYGNGIPFDGGLGTGLDMVFYPANTAPTIGTQIDVISGDTTFPLCGTLCGDRNYSISATVIVDTPFGNQLVGRNNITDSETRVFVVNTQAPLSNGTLTAFKTYNMVGSGLNTFNAIILRPITGSPNNYTVIFDSGQLTVPSVGTEQIQTFPVGPIEVHNGDLIAHYGNGIPYDGGLGTGLDTVFYPVNTAPTIGTQIDVTSGDTTFPLCGTLCSDRNYSIAAIVNLGAPTITGGIRKFVDSLPGLDVGGANNLGQYIPIAIPDKTTYPGSEYYEIELGQYTEKMHSDLPPTTLRGYRQTNTVDPNVSKFHYLGPLIIAKRDIPVRIKFTNSLSAGQGGDLFLPVDPTIMGAGPFMIDDPANPGNTIQGNFTQNRATLHLHGGFNTWISDGTPHQWITPAGETTSYPKGVSVENVPDMPDPGPGSMTFYYNNQQGARLQFYHDHSYGITRLNVYAGEAAGYLVTDQVEKDMIDGTNLTGINPTNAKVLPDVGIPLIIQDKTFVDATTIAQQDPTWNWGTGARVNGNITEVNTGDLWLPHVYMPNQNPSDPSGMNAFGRWHYSPWFFPAPTDVMKGPALNPHCLPEPGVNCSASPNPFEHTHIPDVPNPSFAMEAFMDTSIVNGAAYPYLNVEPKTYRFRILNAANDRFFNLQMYVADPSVTTQDGRTLTEVKMVPAVATTGFPAGWPTDGRAGGVPDPATAGPKFIQIGTEGGFLPEPVEIENQPVDWNMDQTNFDMGVVNKGTLILGTAERADVIVDFRDFAGKTIILYNDAPAPFPAIDARYDYHTGNPNLMDIGGAPSTLAGYGPNTRTIMQIRVNNSPPEAPYDLAALQAVFAKTAGKRGVFEVSQDEIIVQQKVYQTAYDKVYPNDKFVGINDKNKTFLTALGTPMTIEFKAKAIQDETSETYSVEDGRMSAMLGLTQPGIPGFIPFPYVAPPVEIIKDSVYGTPLGSMGDGTQIWKITHNGVDTHTIHVHLFNIQMINRVAWDNAIRKADINEVGWKETLRVNPLQDTIVALRPVAPTQPFKVPNSVRPIDVTMPVDFPLNPPPLGWKDPNGNPATVLNNVVNFGWEYVYHCHLLGHEEMDMMHEVSLTVTPDSPINPSATLGASLVTVNWTDNSTDETNFTIQRNTSTSPWVTLAIVPSTTGPSTGGPLKSYIDTTVLPATTYNYRVLATNIVGDTNTANFPTMSADSLPSGIVTVTTPAALVAAPTNLNATIISGTRIDLNWIDNSNNENRFAVWRSINEGTFIQIGTVNRNTPQRTGTGGTVTFSNTGLTAGQTYAYYVTAVSTTLGPSLPSNTATIVFMVPAAPTGLAGTALRIGATNQANVTLMWTDNANNENSFQIQRANTPAFTKVTSFTAPANLVLAPSLVTYNQNVTRPMTYYYRVRATNLVGSSAWSVFGPLNAP